MCVCGTLQQSVDLTPCGCLGLLPPIFGISAGIVAAPAVTGPDGAACAGAVDCAALGAADADVNDD